MLFNSIAFGGFFTLVFIIYWLVVYKNLRLQNILLLIASYYFYACWDWRFLILLFLISLTNYSIGFIIQKVELIKRKRFYMIIGVIANIGALSYFKYSHFFIESFIDLFNSVGFALQKPTLNFILPIGISFYIFLSLSYIIDIYQNKLKASINIVDVLLTLSFFPIILAGPIQRPILLLPQIQKVRVFNYSFAVDGLKQILWGLFMKVVIADRCASHANDIFQNFNNYNGSTLFLGGIFYTVQVYADFAGYSLIAIGISRLLGFDLIRNFAYPYFSRNISEFWKRWHISLTSWFRDYVFLPISFAVSRKIPAEKVWFVKTDLVIYIVGISITWLLTGLWHGGNYTFIIWGGINGFFLIFYQIFKKTRNQILKRLKVGHENLLLIIWERIFILLIIIFSWIVFRSENIGSSIKYITEILSPSLFALPRFTGMVRALTTIVLV